MKVSGQTQAAQFYCYVLHCKKKALTFAQITTVDIAHNYVLGDSWTNIETTDKCYHIVPYQDIPYYQWLK